MVEISKQDDTLVIGDNIVHFDAPIAQHIEYDGFVVIRTENIGGGHPDTDRNVHAINLDGTTRWKIPKKPDHQPRPYTNIYTKDDGDLWTYNFSGNLYQLDPETGEILTEKFVK